MKTSLGVSVLVLLAAAALSLLGCGPSTGTTQPDGSTLKPYSLLWYMRGRGAEKDEAMVEEAANAYLKDKISATIKIITLDRATYEGHMALTIASQAPFDICFTALYSVSTPLYAQRGAFVALNDPKQDLLDRYLPKTKAILGSFFLQGAEINGVLYAVPVNKEQAHSYGFELRKDIIDKYHLDVSGVRTLKDLEPLLLAVKRLEPRMAHPLGLYHHSIGPEVLLDPDFLAGGPAALYPDLKVRDFLETPDAAEIYATVRRFYEEDLIRKDAASVSDQVPDLQAGRVFAIGTDTIPGDDKVMEDSYGMPWYEVNMTRPRINNGETMGSMNAISTTSRDPARAAMFLELMNTDKYLNNLINFGIEGVHYVKVSDNVIDFAPGTNHGRTSGYNPGQQWSFGNQFLNFLFTNEDPDKWKKMDTYNRSAIPSPRLGFFMDLEPIKTEMAAMANVWEEFMPGLEVGSLDPAVYLPKAIAKFRASGLDRVIQEAQKQFDKWHSGKASHL